MSKKKKKGSSLLTILAISTALIIVGTVVSSAVMFAMQGNANLKIKNDLYYAAESGLELGQSEIVNKPAVATAIMTGAGADVSIRLLNNFDTNIEYVDVKGKKITNTKIELTSTAKKKNSTKTYTLKGEVLNTGPSISSLYEYSLVGKSLEVVLSGGIGTAPSYADGSMAFQTTKLAYESALNLEIWNGSLTPPVRELALPVVKTEAITLNIPPMLTTTHVPRVDLEVKFADTIAGTINSALDRKTLAEGVRKETKVMGSNTLNIYTVNADKLYIYNEPLQDPNSTLVNSIIICSGEVIVARTAPGIDPTNEYPAYKARTDFSKTKFKYEKATIISNKLTVYGNNFHIAYPLLVKDASGNISTHSILTSEADIAYLNDRLEAEMPGWKSAGGGAGTGKWGKVENIVIQ